MKSTILASFMVFSFLPAFAAQAETLPWLEQSNEEEFSVETSLVSDTELEHTRGMFINSPILSSEQFANVSGNSVNGGITGNIAIEQGAFNNANGIITVFQNSGNNVALQSSMIVNLIMAK